MPITPYARLRVRINGGAYQTGRVEIQPGDTIQFGFENVASWRRAEIIIDAYPIGWSGPGIGWTTTTFQDVTTKQPVNVYKYVGTTPPPAFTAPSIELWGKILPRLIVNGGLENGSREPRLFDETMGLTMKRGGLSDLAFAEEGQFGGLQSWVKEHRENLHVLATVLEALGGPNYIDTLVPIQRIDAIISEDFDQLGDSPMTWKAIDWNVEAVSIGFEHSTTVNPSQFTASVNGVYIISSTVGIIGIPNIVSMEAAISVNSVFIQRGAVPASEGVRSAINIATPYSLSANDVVEMYFTTGGVGGVQVDASTTRLRAERIR